MRPATIGRSLCLALASAAGVWCVVPIAAADDMGGRVTALVGDVATRSGRPLAHRSAIADDERIALGEDGACSILLDEDALVEMCERTDVSLRKDSQTGRRRIYLDAGAIRLIVDPRSAAERIEVYTPAAIATILGTIVHFTVDPATGETTITGEESQVRVVSRDPSVPGATTVRAFEQVVMRPGAPPPAQPRRLGPQDIAKLGGCVVDFHQAASDSASQSVALRPAERIATTEAEQPIVAPGWNPAPWNPAPTRETPPASPGEDPARPDSLCNAVDCSGAESESERADDTVRQIETTDGF